MKTFGAGFIAGIVTFILVENGGLGGVLGAIIAAIGGVVTFFLQLPIIAGVGGVLILMFATLLIGREWSERARGRYDAEEAFANRSRHRGVNRPRRNWTVVDRPR
jgi:hypothetical protein